MINREQLESLMRQYMYRYSICMGEYGGIIFADTPESAHERLKEVYGVHEDIDIEVWCLFDDDFYNDDCPEVLECYGIGGNGVQSFHATEE